MIKSEFWKLMAFAEHECDLSTLRWLEGLGFYYAMHSEECDKWISAFEFFDDDEEE